MKYQTGTTLQLFTANERLPGATCPRAFDKSAKSFVYCLETPSAKLALSGLKVKEPFLVLQLCISSPSKFTLELGCIDNLGQMRRLSFSANAGGIVRNLQHARLPNAHFRRGEWLNLTIDIQRCFSFAFPGFTCRLVGRLDFTSYCRVRRVFSMLDPLTDSDDGTAYRISLPRKLDFPAGVSCFNQKIDEKVYTDNEQRNSNPTFKPHLANRSRDSSIHMQQSPRKIPNDTQGQGILKQSYRLPNRSGSFRLSPLSEAKPKPSISSISTPITSNFPGSSSFQDSPTGSKIIKLPPLKFREFNSNSMVVLPDNLPSMKPYAIKIKAKATQAREVRLKNEMKYQSQFYTDEDFDEIEENIEDCTNKPTLISTLY